MKKHTQSVLQMRLEEATAKNNPLYAGATNVMEAYRKTRVSFGDPASELPGAEVHADKVRDQAVRAAFINGLGR